MASAPLKVTLPSPVSMCEPSASTAWLTVILPLLSFSCKLPLTPLTVILPSGALTVRRKAGWAFASKPAGMLIVTLTESLVPRRMPLVSGTLASTSKALALLVALCTTVFVVFAGAVEEKGAQAATEVPLLSILVCVVTVMRPNSWLALLWLALWTTFSVVTVIALLVLLVPVAEVVLMVTLPISLHTWIWLSAVSRKL